MSTSEPVEKFDFQNMDVKLYLVLKKMIPEFYILAEECSGSPKWELVRAAELAVEEFELSFGPLPDWAIARNWDYSLVPGAQLLTKDGRQHGNAHIIRAYGKFMGTDVDVFEVLTDAGSRITFSEVELNNSFYIGDWISDPARVLNDFDRNGEFRDEQ
jgi:hypothetical protein